MKETNDLLREQRVAREKNLLSAYPATLVLSIGVFFLYVFLVCFSPLSDKEEGLLGWLNQSNTTKYFVGLVIFAVAFLLFRFLSRWFFAQRSERIFNTPLSRKGQLGAFAALVLVAGIFLLVYLFYVEASGSHFGNDPDSVYWRILPVGLVLCYTIAVSAFFVWQIYSGKELSGLLTFGVYLVAIVLTYYSFLYINILDTHHGVAYVETIFNVYHGVPYDNITSGIYGHYGIFYAAALHLLGGNAETMFRLIALSGAVSTVAIVYIVHKVIKRNDLRVLSVLASILSIAALRYKNYWQLQPHRVLFPLLLVAYLVYMTKHNAYRRSRILLGYVLCAVSIVWNTESGLFCTVAFTLALIVHDWQTEEWHSKRMLWRYPLLIGGAVASLLGAILFVNVYNLICGGEWILKDFFFPLFEDGFMNGTLKADLPAGIQVWILVLILFFLLLFYGLYHTRLVRGEQTEWDSLAPVYVALAVVALFNYSYYANRSAYYNLDIISQMAGIAMGIFADRFLDNWRNIQKVKMTFSKVAAGALSFLCVIVITVMSSQIVCAVPTLVDKQQDDVWNVELLNEQAEQMAEIVPEDYLLVGKKACIYYLQTGREAIHYYRDLSDLWVGDGAAVEKLVKDAVEHGKVAFYLNSADSYELMEMVLLEGDFVLVSSGVVDEYEVLCFSKK